MTTLRRTSWNTLSQELNCSLPTSLNSATTVLIAIVSWRFDAKAKGCKKGKLIVVFNEILKLKLVEFFSIWDFSFVGASIALPSLSPGPMTGSGSGRFCAARNPRCIARSLIAIGWSNLWRSIIRSSRTYIYIYKISYFVLHYIIIYSAVSLRCQKRRRGGFAAGSYLHNGKPETLTTHRSLAN